MLIELTLQLIVGGILVYLYYLWGGKKALDLYVVPILVLIPFAYGFTLTPGLPPFTFYSVAIIVLVSLVLYWEAAPFQWRAIDTLVVVFVLATWVLSIVVDGFVIGLITLVDKTVSNLIPYFLIRYLVERKQVLRTLVALGLAATFVALFAPLEYFYDIKFAQILQFVWPDQVLPPPFIRGGYYRVFSTFGHPIWAGMVFSVGVFVGFLTLRMKVFRRTWLPVAMIVINAVAIYMTVSRTSYILVPALLILLNFAFVRKKMLYGTIFGIVFLLVILVVMPMWNAYVASGAAGGADETATSAAYRAVLFDNYLGKIMEKPLLGWGFNIPSVGIQTSLDNYYLYLLLRYGIPMTIFFGVILVVALVQGLFYYSRATLQKDHYMIWGLITILVYIGIVAQSVWFPPVIRVVLFSILGMMVTIYDPPRQGIAPLHPFKRLL